MSESWFEVGDVVERDGRRYRVVKVSEPGEEGYAMFERIDNGTEATEER